MRGTHILICAMLCVALVAHSQNLAAHFEESEKDFLYSYAFNFDARRQSSLTDALLYSESQRGFTKEPEHPPLEIVKSDRPEFDYQAQSPYYAVYFKGTTVKMEIECDTDTDSDGGTCWLLFSVDTPDQKAYSVTTHNNSIALSEVFDKTDISYEVDTSVLTELLTLKERREVDRFITLLSWEGMEPVFEEDGGILFSGDNGEKIIKILPPTMRDASGSISRDLHYELIPADFGWELHKVIDETGKKWLESAQYPVYIDPSMQTFEDAWESSGLTPYNQYFKNLSEYVCPSNGHLIITQTDLTIPGRGLDVKISRIYETPAIMYGGLPYDAEDPPVTVGRGWQLNLQYNKKKKVHMWGGTVYKQEWNNNIFENHTGSHFILAKKIKNSKNLTQTNEKKQNKRKRPASVRRNTL
jgi:hypothetical protein